MRIALLAIAVAVAWSSGTGARADDAAAAKAAFEDGTRLFHDGQFDEAALAFRQAHRLRPNWKLLYNIGQSEAAAKRHGLALQAFEEYLAEAGDEVGVERRNEVAAEIDRLRGMVGEIELKAPEGARILVDERERGTAPLPGTIPVAAGKLHRLRVERDGEVLLERDLRVGSRRTVAIDATAGAAEAAGPAAPATGNGPAGDSAAGERDSAAPSGPALAPDGLAVGGWVLVGVGAAALIGSAVTGGLALSLDEELADDCPNQQCEPDHYGDVDRLGRLSVASDVLTGVGAAAVAAGGVMVVVSVVRDKRETADPALALVPLTDTERLGLAIEGRF